MDWQIAFNAVVAIAMAMGGWIMGRISKSLDLFDSELRALPEKYVSKDDHNRQFDLIQNSLQRIEDKLDGKQDKDNRR